ncbi:Hint domain-containing protein [Thalassobium sp. R2A62]|jgi:hypothetical protein|uniref:Hint domain-containing protein n=1 Tax=Thalassobium sp. R2A62 TaxID=633131 RepID=UPI0001B1D6ED|nr:Hint domain-containing protein [Thalassobium sp. R2A62]EET49288.1 hypothetical protein TR2A62_2816 [Thalassobium sp. R2A62]
MSWIGLSDPEGGTFAPRGLTTSQVVATPSDPMMLLPQGTFLCELNYLAGGTTLRLCDYKTVNPWPVNVSLVIGPNGTLTLTIVQGSEMLRARLTTDLTNGDNGVVIAYTWDAPARKSALSVFIPERGKFYVTDVQGAMPLVRKCAGQLVGQRTIENVNFVAVSDQVEPVGPMPGLSGAARIRTTKGIVAANKVRPGDLVQMHDGDIAQVRWCGSVDLPARGQFQPLRVRAPYFGATHDVYVAAEQHMLFSGSEVEYLFGEESVLASARHLIDHVSVLPAPQVRIMRYHHFLLDRPGIMSVSGAPIESFDASSVLRDHSLLSHSVLANMPPELLPKPDKTAHPLLRGFETVTLAALRAA